MSLLILMACAGTRRLPEGKVLYTGSEVQFSKDPAMDKKQVHRSLQDLLQPEPNTSVFGWRPRLWIYNVVGEVKKEKGIKHWFKYKMGQAPVFLSEVNVERVGRQLEDRMLNKGYFQARVTPDVHQKERTAKVKYLVHPGRPFVLGEVAYPDSTSHLNRTIRAQKHKSRVRAGARFDLEIMNTERKRLERVVRDSGYYHFNSSYLIYDADSTVGDHEVDLDLRKKASLHPIATSRFTISAIEILPGYSSEHSGRAPVVIDSMDVYLDPEEIRPRSVANAVGLNVGEFYSRNREEITINRLSGMGVFKYINLNFEEDSARNTLHTRINLVPYKRKSIRLQLNAVTKSNSFVGPFFSASFINRNFLGGGERFRVSLTSGFEAQLNRGDLSGLNSYELGVDASLTVPRLIVPFHVNESDSKYDFSTTYAIGVRTQRRVGFFTLFSTDVQMGYRWNHRVIHRYEAYPVNVNLFNLVRSSEAFQELLENDPFLRNTYQDQFILGGRYSYFYNSRSLDQQYKYSDNYYFNANLNVSGNAMQLVQAVVAEEPNGNGGAQTIAGLPYAQFSKLDLDFRYYHRIDRRNRLAFRIILGGGYAYGNSTSMPYTHQFAIAGSNSIRAFRPRSVGPGEYVIPDSVIQNRSFVDQTADIKLELNAEFRFDVFKKLKGAVFLDAGNIWTARREDSRPGGEFRLDRFYKQIAIGTGVGLRYDLDFLILRLDVGTPLRVPDRPEGDRWVFDEIALDKKEWRRQNLIFNIGIGYPF